MKTLLTTICVLTTPLSVMAQQNNGQGEQIDLQVNIIPPEVFLVEDTKAPVQPPYVTYLDHTLYIWSQHNGYTLTLLDDNDTVVYQTYVALGVQYAVLPATLSGSFTLVLSDDTYLYTGVIDLE